MAQSGLRVTATGGDACTDPVEQGRNGWMDLVGSALHGIGQFNVCPFELCGAGVDIGERRGDTECEVSQDAAEGARRPGQLVGGLGVGRPISQPS